MLTFNIGNMMSTKEYILIYGTIFVAACFLPHTDTSLFPSVVQEDI